MRWNNFGRYKTRTRAAKLKRSTILPDACRRQQVASTTAEVGRERLVTGASTALVTAVVRQHRVAYAECPLMQGLHRAKSVVDLFEVRSVRRRVVPAVIHYRINVRRTVLGPRQQLVGAHQVYDLLIVTVEIRSDAVAEDLPQQDTERPDITLRGEGSVEEGFGGHPPDGQEGVAYTKILFGAAVPAHAQVRYLDEDVVHQRGRVETRLR